MYMRRMIAALLLGAALFLSACDTGPGLDLRLFCERFNRAWDGRALLELGQFTAEETAAGTKYAAYAGMGDYITCEAGPGGRLHTVSLTGLPEQGQGAFFDAARCVIQAYTDAAADQAERWLRQVRAGEAEVPGVLGFEDGGFRFSYAANAAGRWLRVSQLRFLPPEPELATLREEITEE
jgi:hypothetical protein